MAPKKSVESLKEASVTVEKKRKVKILDDEKPKPKRKIKIIEESKRKIIVVDEPTMVEEDEPIKVAVVHKVCLQKFKHGSKNYYLDSERDKLYEFLGEKKHGKYIGRWDSLLEEIIAGEDSDVE